MKSNEPGVLEKSEVYFSSPSQTAKKLYFYSIIISKSNPDWAEDFIKEFATYQVPFHFLCTRKRLAIKGHFMNGHCEFSDGITTYR